MTNFISQDYLRKIMHYDETSGNFTWIKKKRGTKHRFKKNAGYLNRNGYIEIRIDGKLFKAHRLAVNIERCAWDKYDPEREDS
ncbi:hypothetical protein TX36_06415 [Salmonella enterica]|nr:hypothetical protein [Salmonella enterica]EAS1995600.1 hypothetical protein [Salmonella enterica]EBQ7173593.1 hypothetical protein [Salmonella enterica]MIL02297.1 hypothetical protein [Salmonella enterica subsp. enterica]